MKLGIDLEKLKQS